MKKQLFIILSAMLMASVSQFSIAAECDTVYGVDYVISKISQSKPHKRNTFELSLWRNQQQVIYINHQSATSTKWQKTANNRIRKVSYFDEFERAIEYEPSAALLATFERNFHIITYDVRNKMTLVATAGTGCEQVQQLELTDKNIKLKVWWQPSQQLVQKLERITASDKTLWQAKKVITAEQGFKSIVAKLHDYHATDYADIGDNESDPFLVKMINLGFVEHGASGFYDSQGHSLSGGHQH
ncbi:hypothetical protein [Thalassotalea sp. PLHSN55]|uniref:hypothetical protein n=1 Tax=Thalassotalea sp. PLHSN55 TaxID=3435888 RepID=UPI003F86298C